MLRGSVSRSTRSVVDSRRAVRAKLYFRPLDRSAVHRFGHEKLRQQLFFPDKKLFVHLRHTFADSAWRSSSRTITDRSRAYFSTLQRARTN